MNRWKEFFRLARRNLRRNRRRNLSTSIAICLGFIGLLVLGGYLYKVQNYLRVYSIFSSQIGHAIIYKKDGYEKFSSDPRNYSISKQEQIDLKTLLTAQPEVERVGTKLYGSGLIGNGCRSTPFVATGVESDIDLWTRAHPEMERWAKHISNFSKGNAISKYDAAISPVGIAAGLAFLLNKNKVHDEVVSDNSVQILQCDSPDLESKLDRDANVQLAVTTWSGMFTATDGEVVNHFNTGLTETESTGVLMNIQQLQKLLDTDAVASISIWLKDEAQLRSFLEKMQTRLSGSNFEIFPWDNPTINPYYYGTVQFLKTMIIFIAIVLLAIIAFSIVNSVTMTVLERSQEVGMMRSLGFARGDILKIFVAEVTLLCGFSVIAGLVLGLGVMEFVNLLDIHFNPPGIAGGMQLRLIPNLKIVSLTTFIVMLLGIFSTWTTVRRASRAKIPLLLSSFQR